MSLIGNNIDCYNFEVLDLSNEQHGSSNQSQTNSARLYEFTELQRYSGECRCTEHSEYV